MESGLPSSLASSEIHGFRTMQDLDVVSIMKEAGSRWLRPNEIYAILSNHARFTVNIKPVHLPKSGQIVLFDRKMLRNFRKDGHNWKKKKDGKTVKEAHEHLKVGTAERIHVYYAHGEDDPHFVRRCYWLLDKSLEHIVLVHYRQTQELQGSPVTPLNSHSGSDFSELSPSQLLQEETDSGTNRVVYTRAQEFMAGDGLNTNNHEIKLHEINTLEWDELLASSDFNMSGTPLGENINYVQLHSQNNMNSSAHNGSNFLERNSQLGIHVTGALRDPVAGTGSVYNDQLETMLQSTMSQINPSEQKIVSDNLSKVGLQLQPQDSFGRWMSTVMADSPGSVDDPSSESSLLASSFMPSESLKHGKPIPEQIFCISDISPTWASSAEETKILVVGNFHEDYQHLARSNMFCVCDDIYVPAEVVQVGVYRCLVPPHSAGLVYFFLSIDGCKPISQVLTLEFRAPVYKNIVTNEDSSWEEFRLQMRLAHLLFSTSKSLDISVAKVPRSTVDEAKRFSMKCASIKNSWSSLIKQIENGKISFFQAKESLFEITLKNRLKECLLETVLHGSKFSDRDSQGQGVLHLCAILGYAWAAYPYTMAGLSLDFRDKSGWTALHWAAHCGREKMVAALLSGGAKPNLVTDPTTENPAGLTAADLAYKKGYDGLAGYLSEKALIQQFEDMKIAGNAQGSLETAMHDPLVNISSQNEDEAYLKDTLSAYRTAAGAAARIQAAFRENSFKKRAKSVERSSPEMEARVIIAAMKIQHAYRNYETKRKMAAAASIQYRFRTWKMRREFLNMRQQAIKIQSAFRGFQVRKQYQKIVWSVGILEKVILRWCKRRRGLRGLEIKPAETVPEQNEGDTEEDFFRASRKQAEERVEKAVVRVQAMFRSKQAQEEYRRMKLTHNQAQLEFEESLNDGACMDS